MKTIFLDAPGDLDPKDLETLGAKYRLVDRESEVEVLVEVVENRSVRMIDLRKSCIRLLRGEPECDLYDQPCAVCHERIPEAT